MCADNAKTAENVCNTFVDTWIYGQPDVVVLDPGKEFEGCFADMAQEYSMTILPTDRESPWQNGRTERAGGLWKSQFKIAARRCTPFTQEEWLTLVSLCVQVQNRYQLRSGSSRHSERLALITDFRIHYSVMIPLTQLFSAPIHSQTSSVQEKCGPQLYGRGQLRTARIV